MSDISSATKLAPAASQLLANWYFDERIFALEKKLIFDAGPGYVGHELMVPELGNYRTQEWLDHAKMLVRNDDTVWQMSNICRHRQAIMLEGSGTIDRTVVCPIHRWTYDRQGELIGAPHFPQNPCLHLNKRKLESWNGLLFGGPRSANADLGGMNIAGDFDFSGYKLDKVEVHECNYNWKTFIEVYLEDYHVAPFHPGPGKFCHLRRPDLAVRRLVFSAARWRYFVDEIGFQDLRALAAGRARVLRRGETEAGCGVADLLPEHHGRVVSARAGRIDADSA